MVTGIATLHGKQGNRRRQGSAKTPRNKGTVNAMNARCKHTQNAEHVIDRAHSLRLDQSSQYLPEYAAPIKHGHGSVLLSLHSPRLDPASFSSIAIAISGRVNLARPPPRSVFPASSPSDLAVSLALSWAALFTGSFKSRVPLD